MKLVSQIHIFSAIPVAALVPIVKRLKQPMSPLICKGIIKIWYLPSMNYQSSLGKKKDNRKYMMT